MDIQKKTLTRRLEIWLHLGIWVLFLLLHALIFTRFLQFEVSLIRSIINVLPMAFLFYVNLTLVNRFLEQKRYFLYILIIIGVLIIITIVRTEMNMLFPEVRREIIFMDEQQSWGISAALTNLSILGISIFYQILYNRYQNEQRNLTIINEQKEAQLQFLRAQINPHFLFNTLNNIYSLAVIKSDKTAEMVLKLSNLLRYVIYDGKGELVSLQHEIEHIRQFIALFQMRYEEPIDIQFNIEGDVSNINIEPMILIPLVENCFKHCDFDTNEQAFIRIYLKIANKVLYFQTINTKNNQDVQKDKVGGVGLENIRKRLELKHIDSFSLLVNNKEALFEIEMKLNIL